MVMTKKTWIVFIIITAIIFGGIIFASRNDSSKIDVSSVNANSFIEASDKNGQIADHAFGTTTGKFVVVEYADYQCPACAKYSPIFKSIAETYKDKITFIFRNYPLTSIHPNAFAAASLVEAAGLQGKFWQMHDFIYEKQSDWTALQADKRTDAFLGYAKDLNLDVDRVKEDMSSSAVSTKINFDMALGRRESLNGTPSIIVDGKKLGDDIWGDEAKFKAFLDEKLK